NRASGLLLHKMNQLANSGNGSGGNATAPPIFISVPVGNVGMQTFCAVFIPIVCGLGIIGNSLAFILLKESASRVSSHFYLCCLAVADSVTLVSIMMSIWLGVIMQGYYYVIGQFTADNWVRVATGICWFTQFRVYLSFLCRMVSVWLVVVLSIERCISVLSPLKWGTRLCTVRNGVKAVVALVLVSSLLNIYVIIGFERKQVGKQHRCVPNDFFFIGRLAGKAVLSVVPWIIICIANGLLVAVLRRRNRRATSGGLSNRQERQEMSITVRLLAVSVAFLLFTLPITVMSAIHSYHEIIDSTEHKGGVLANLWLLAFAMFTCNFGCNFLLYCFTGQNFRRAAAALLACRVERMKRLRDRLDRSGSQTASGGGTSSGVAGVTVSGSEVPVGRSDSGNSRTVVTYLSRESSDLSGRQRLLRKETRI
ncbi:hypothetical protein BOX15_Mlig018741g1, partial [Macrostomum lignano]